MEIVNGFVCRDCADAALAKQFVDSAHPQDGSIAARSAEIQPEPVQPAVVLGGSLAALDPTNAIAPLGRSVETPAVENRPGALVDLQA